MKIISIVVGVAFIVIAIGQIVLAVERDKMDTKDAICGWMLAIVWCIFALIFSP